jgi:rhamnose transport system permease protein
MVTFGFGLLNVPGIIMTVFIGALLIVTISIPVVIQAVRSRTTARALTRHR